MRLLVYIAIFLSVLTSAFSQQMPNYNHWYSNPYLINPGYAGHDSLTNVYLLYRNEFVGVTGAPQTQLLSVNSQFGKRDMGFAGQVYNDMSNIYRKTGGYLSYSYLIKIDSLHLLRAGLSLGVLNYGIDFDKIQAENPDESTLLTNAQTATKLDGGLGLVYNFGDKLEAGFSMMQLFQNKLNYQNQANEEELNYQLLRHYYLSAKYHFIIKPNEWDIYPMALLKSTQGTPIQWDLGVQGKWRNMVWATAMYRSNYSMALSAGGFVNENVQLGYAFEIPTNGVGAQLGSSHEIVLSFTFKKNKKKETKLSEVSSEEVKALNDKIDSLETRVILLEEGAEKHKQEFDSVVVKKQEMKDLINKNAQEIAAKVEQIESLKRQHELQREEWHEFYLKENVDLAKLDTFNTAVFNYYIVIGTYRDMNYTKYMQRQLVRDYGLQTKVTRHEEENYYIVYTKEITTTHAAEAEINRVNGLIDDKYLDEGAWLYRIRKPFSK